MTHTSGSRPASNKRENSNGNFDELTEQHATLAAAFGRDDGTQMFEGVEPFGIIDAADPFAGEAVRA